MNRLPGVEDKDTIKVSPNYIKENSFVAKMKPLQIANNCRLHLNSIDINDKKSLEAWAEQVFEDNWELFKEQSKDQFINYIVYGKYIKRNGFTSARS